MSDPLSRDVPKGAAAVIVALALVAGVVTGRETPREAPAKAPPREATSSVPIEEIDLKRLARLRGEGEIQDLFAPPDRPRPVVTAIAGPGSVSAAKPEPASPPSVPPLPFTYLGRMTKEEQVIVYLLRNQELLVARAGEALDDNYRVERISGTAVELTYVPLGTRQVLALP